MITDYLVTFDDIATLQKRNEQLLAVVRKLSEEQEQLERSGTAGVQGGCADH